MNEENKYYFPSIEEFYEGFEFEYDNSKNWQEASFDLVLHSQEIEKDILANNIRVKLLDKEDIESLGFNNYSVYPKYMFIKDDYHIHLHPNGNTEIIKEPVKNLEEFTGRLFLGRIKNKSELQKLLKQLHINE